MTATKKIVYWSVLFIALLCFGALGLWKGVSKGQAQCVKFKLQSCKCPDVNCGAGWTEVNEVVANPVHGYKVALCVING